MTYVYRRGDVVEFSGQLYWLGFQFGSRINARRVQRKSNRRYEFDEPKSATFDLPLADLQKHGKLVGKGSLVLNEHLQLRSIR